MALIPGHSFFSAKSGGILVRKSIVHRVGREKIRSFHDSDTGGTPGQALDVY